MSSGPAFVHLRVHTEYSLVDSVVRVKPLMNAVAQADMPAVALTDESNLFAMVKFYRAAEARGIKPIIGADLWLDLADERDPLRFTLLCQDRNGYANLLRLITRSYVEGDHKGHARVSREWLCESAAGLIALSGGRAGDVGRALLNGNEVQAAERLGWWRELFPDRYYLELQRTGRPDEATYNNAAVKLAAANAVPVVATNDVCFINRADYESHEARVCIHDGYTLADPQRPRRHTEQQYLRTPAEMAELFAEVPEALENTVEIARRCNLEIEFGRSVLPDFPVPDSDTVDSYLARKAGEGLDERLRQVREHHHERSDYEARLRSELEVISGMGFPGYFLVVADFIHWARNNKIPVGPGRGSGAGSVVAWALQITDLDPLEHDLLFERFLNPERVSMPDFDIDFCMEGRDRVIEYVADRYGHDKVSQIITFGSMAARAVVRDVGRVLGHPYGFVDRIAKLIPFEVGMTLDKALDSDDELRRVYEGEEEIRALIDLARSLEGLARNAGKHAGGVVIAPSQLIDYTPLYTESGVEAVTQYDKDDVEAIGLVKFDFLGLRTLTIIDWAVQTINSARAAADEPVLEIAELPMDDAATYALLKSCTTTAVFQLESRGMKDLIKRLQPDCFEDIVALVALFRPGPLQSGMVDDFIQRKHGQAVIVYPHPQLEQILRPTYGVILYQEQVMQIAQELSGYSLGGADLLRRAMGKKKPEEMARQRSVFLDGAEERGVDRAVAAGIFDLIEKFAGYGFNRSHSAGYAVLSYQTAWLKAHYPAAFMAAVLSADMDHTDKIVTIIDDCHNIGLDVLSPDVNYSGYKFDVASDQAIRYGLGAIKGVGRAAVESIINERDAGEPYADLHDLCARIDLQRVNKRVLEALIRAGALDGIGPNRATLMAQLPTALRLADQSARASAAGQVDLFGLEPAAAASGNGAAPAELLPEWPDAERLAGERDTLGLFLTGHPVDEFAAELAALTAAPLAELMAENAPTEPSWRSPKRNVTVAGLVLDLRRAGSRLIVTLDDRSARMEVMFFDDVFQQFRDLLQRDAILVIGGLLRYDDFSSAWRLTAKSVQTLDQARAQYARKLVIRWQGTAEDAAFARELQQVLAPYRDGQCEVSVHYHGSGAVARLQLGSEWSVRPCPELLSELHALAGNEHVHIVYPHLADMAG
ncbi:MAG: DNA polymerase III subunit alpha [Gammaproteobacteria bacterium]|nr:DNA polymerase III subunit alpha [Gammaproteobacteria bacterium]NNF59822.1 DNA polymerase III subunit alpha [Gammaproteobacteria bacterium]NNM21304.1 DNA polymerase III subunit alpha [Gammaproteobacteria bacterium]